MNNFSLIENLASHVQKKQDKIAIESDEFNLTYLELWNQVLEVEKIYKNKGIGSGDRLAINISNNFALCVIHIIVMAKNKITYIPISNNWPDQFKREAILISRANFYLESLSFEKDFLIINRIDSPSNRDINSINYAYIMFTSGSTGKPKGVPIKYEALENNIIGTNNIFRTSSTDVFSMLHELSFDVSQWELWSSIYRGGKLSIMLDYLKLKYINKLACKLEKEKVTVMRSTPTLLSKIILETDFSKNIPNLKKIILAGEKANPKNYVVLFKNNIEIYNCYGATETTIDAMYHLFDEEDYKYNLSSIGLPLPNYHISYKKDGEIIVSGISVIDEYINSSSTKFKKNSNGEISFYTGDYTEINRNKRVFVSRKYDHAKISGNRINLDAVGEIILRDKRVSNCDIKLRNDKIDAYIYLNNFKRFNIEDNKYTKLPNGYGCYFFNIDEVMFLYKEIFVCREYDKHIPVLSRNPNIIDVGANIGMFSIHHKLINKESNIIAIEPVTEIYSILEKNADLYGFNTTIKCGISSQNKESNIYFNQMNTIVSSVSNIDNSKENTNKYSIENIKLRTLSSIINELSLHKIDLIKIDIEGEEYNALLGIMDYHWHLINNIVIETSRKDYLHDKIIVLLKSKGFDIVINSNTDFYTIFGRKVNSKNKVIQLRYEEYNENFLIKELKKRVTNNMPMFGITINFYINKSISLGTNNKSTITSKNTTENSKDRILFLLANILIEQGFKLSVGYQDQSLLELGMSSKDIILFAKEINEKIGVIKISKIIKFSKLSYLADYLEKNQDIQDNSRIKEKNLNTNSSNIAIIGIGCNLPNTNSLESFFNNMFKNIDMLNRGEISINNYECGGILDNLYSFDHDFFNITSKNAEKEDPQHRQMLICAYNSLRNAGVLVEKNNNIGVFVGTGKSRYIQDIDINIKTFKDELDLDFKTEKDYVATKIAYYLDLNGPAINIANSCTTGSIALITAIQNLLDNTCDIALSGSGFSLIPERLSFKEIRNTTLSSTGYCKPFTKDADGIVVGSCFSIFTLKRLDDAIKDHDHIYAVINGYGINNDGFNKLSYTAPNPEKQKECILVAEKRSGVPIESYKYIEAHGTGTKIGDMIETEAITSVFLKRKYNRSKIYIGSAKANYGHCDSASSMVGMMRAISVAYYKKIPPQLYSKNIISDFSGRETCLEINKDTVTLDKNIVCGVNSFGIGGTNCHIVISNYDNKTIHTNADFYFLLVSTHNYNLLSEEVVKIKRLLEGSTDETLFRIMMTLKNNIHHGNIRTAFIAKSHADMMILLDKKYSISKVNSLIDINENNIGRNIYKWVVGEIDSFEFPYNQSHYIKFPLPPYSFMRTEHIFLKKTESKNIESQYHSIASNDLDKIINEFQEYLGESVVVNLNTDYYKEGGESLDALDILSFIEDEFSFKMDLDDFYLNCTPQKLHDFIKNHSISKTKNNIIQHRKISINHKNQRKIFFISPINDNSSNYQGIFNQLSDENVYLLKNINKNLELEPDSMKKLAYQYAKAIIQLSLEDEVYIVGWSYSGNMSLLISEILQDFSITIKNVFMLDSWAKYNEDYNDFSKYKNLISNYAFDYEKSSYIEDWSELLWKRTKTLFNNRHNKTNIEVILFKAINMLEEYIDIADDSNGWGEIIKNLYIYKYDADHISLLKYSHDIGRVINEYVKK